MSVRVELPAPVGMMCLLQLLKVREKGDESI